MWLRRGADGALLALPGGLVAYTAFNAGGFFAGTESLLAGILAIVLLLRVTLSERPFAGAGRTLVVAAGAMALFAAWILASSAWSHSPGRALLEFDRALLYLLALVLFGSLPMTPRRLAWMVRGVVAAAVVVCVFALLSRLLPHVLPTTPNVASSRLSYPITYWNALGLFGAMATILALHLTCGEREPVAARVMAAAALPVLAATVYLTFSRGAIGAGAIGLVVYLVLGRPRLLLGGLIGAVPATVVAVAHLYGADALAATDPTGSAAVAQGREAAVTIALCAAGAALLRGVLAVADAWLLRRDPREVPRRVALAAVAALVVAGLAVFLVAGGPGYVGREVQGFVKGKAVGGPRADLRSRLSDPSSNGRVDLWRVSLQGFAQQPVRGQGAGTFQLQWERRRPEDLQVFDGHSLYLETLGEMGIVGLVLVVVALVAVLGGAAWRIRRPQRPLFAAILAIGLAWAIHAQFDWDWEMPTLTLWVFTLGAAALATALPARGAVGERVEGPLPPRIVRVVVGLGLLVLAIAPLQVAASQRSLDRSAAAFEGGDCARTVDQSLAASEAVAVRPEPYELLGFCDAHLRQNALALMAMRRAVRLDPGNWEYHYGLALVSGAAGMDPLPEVREAHRLNPLEPLASDAVSTFATRDPRQWVRRALTAELPQS